jgi:hypothetical protein
LQGRPNGASWLFFTAGLGIGDADVFGLGGILSVVIILLVAGAVMRRGRGSDQPRAST